MTLDLEMAKRVLKERGLSLVIVRDGEVIFESKFRGIIGLIRAINVLGGDLSSSSVADKVVGRAAALLLAYSRAGEVYAAIISELGLSTLNEYGIRVEYDTIVPKIMNRRGDDICPFEKISLTISSPKEAYERLKNYAESFRNST
ncbi:MAG: DUF1893 domain-containing protein [Candidatus Bathyarchaeia archaeon]